MSPKGYKSISLWNKKSLQKPRNYWKKINKELIKLLMMFKILEKTLQKMSKTPWLSIQTFRKKLIHCSSKCLTKTAR